MRRRRVSHLPTHTATTSRTTEPRPPLDLAIGDSADERLAEIGGGLSVALARCFKIIERDLKNPQTTHWERSFQIFGLLL